MTGPPALAHQPHLPGHRAARRPGDRRDGGLRQRARDGAGRSRSCSAGSPSPAPSSGARARRSSRRSRCSRGSSPTCRSSRPRSRPATRRRCSRWPPSTRAAAPGRAWSWSPTRAGACSALAGPLRRRPRTRRPRCRRCARRSAALPASSFGPHPQGILQVVTVPITVGGDPASDGRHLSVGFLLDALGGRPSSSGSPAARSPSASDGRIRASTLPAARGRPSSARSQAGRTPGVFARRRRLRRAVAGPFRRRPGAGARPPAAPEARADRGRAALAHRAAALPRPHPDGHRRHRAPDVLLATLLSYAVARTVTRPLGRDHQRDARGGRDRRPDAEDPGAAGVVGRRGRARCWRRRSTR